MSQKRTGYLVIAVLLAVSGVAFLRAEQLKLQHSPVGAVQIQKQFSTTCPVHANLRCRSHSARLSFRLRNPGRLALAIVDGSGRVVDRLGSSGRRHGRGRVTITWDGRETSGATAADGTYHLRVSLLDLHRTITIPDPIGLDTTAPTLTLPDGPGHLPLRYRTSEQAVVFVHAVAVGGADAGHGALFRGHGGRVHFRRTRLAGAQVRITLVAVDPAGNASAPVDAGVIRLPA
jgi:flagellar hook capping protein FlgD